VSASQSQPPRHPRALRLVEHLGKVGTDGTVFLPDGEKTSKTSGPANRVDKTSPAKENPTTKSQMPESNNDEDLRATIAARANAIRSKNAQGVISNFTEDSVGFFLAPPLRTSPLKEDLTGWFATWRGLIGYEITDLRITSSDDIAYCHSVSRLTGPRTDGGETDVWFRETFCLRKRNGRWLIAHIHESVPMYMDGSLKAAIDLRP
jgi:ketosteroid isomerase-like protein